MFCSIKLYTMTERKKYYDLKVPKSVRKVQKLMCILSN